MNSWSPILPSTQNPAVFLIQDGINASSPDALIENPKPTVKTSVIIR